MFTELTGAGVWLLRQCTSYAGPYEGVFGFAAGPLQTHEDTWMNAPNSHRGNPAVCVRKEGVSGGGPRMLLVYGSISDVPSDWPNPNG